MVAQSAPMGRIQRFETRKPGDIKDTLGIIESSVFVEPLCQQADTVLG
jgi:hypothetical protein